MNKQDELKAKDISDNWVPQTFQEVAYEAAMEMSAWKEEQMIEKAVEFLKLHIPFGEVSESLKDEVIEDFKEVMEK